MRIVSNNNIESCFKKIEEYSDVTSLIFHTDIWKIGIIDKFVSQEKMLKDYTDVFLKFLAPYEMWFPSFNYDFAKTGTYNVLDDEAQVGVLNQAFLKLFPENRTLTPIFNFVSTNRIGKQFRKCENVFGQDSIFQYFLDSDSLLVFFGASFSSNTFLHFVEESANIGYRYLKNFKGRLLVGQEVQEISINYRVRPLNTVMVEYDWQRLEKELISANILRIIPCGKDFMRLLQIRALFDFWLPKLNHNEMYLLTPQSVASIVNAKKNLSYPFIINEFENE